MKKAKKKAIQVRRKTGSNHVLLLPKGLSFEAAWKLCVSKATVDFRGMRYDAITGKAVLV